MVAANAPGASLALRVVAARLRCWTKRESELTAGQDDPTGFIMLKIQRVYIEFGGVAQLVERLIRIMCTSHTSIHEVRGSIPLVSICF